ncbi:hypothetical protein ACFSF7_12925, partial [Ligilactobacillus acidipiscis]
ATNQTIKSSITTLFIISITELLVKNFFIIDEVFLKLKSNNTNLSRISSKCLNVKRNLKLFYPNSFIQLKQQEI